MGKIRNRHKRMKIEGPLEVRIGKLFISVPTGNTNEGAQIVFDGKELTNVWELEIHIKGCDLPTVIATMDCMLDP